MPAESAHAAADSGHAELLHASVADFVARGIGIARARRLRGTRPGFERVVWRQMTELGWLGILVPEPYGGSSEIQRNILAKYVLQLPS